MCSGLTGCQNKSLDEDTDETEEERKAREQRAVRDADLENAKDLFAGLATPCM